MPNNKWQPLQQHHPGPSFVRFKKPTKKSGQSQNTDTTAQPSELEGLIFLFSLRVSVNFRCQHRSAHSFSEMRQRRATPQRKLRNKQEDKTERTIKKNKKVRQLGNLTPQARRDREGKAKKQQQKTKQKKTKAVSHSLPQASSTVLEHAAPAHTSPHTRRHCVRTDFQTFRARTSQRKVSGSS